MGEHSTAGARRVSVGMLGDRDTVEEGQDNTAGEFLESQTQIYDLTMTITG